MQNYFSWLIKIHFKKYTNYIPLLIYPIFILILSIILKNIWQTEKIYVYDILAGFVLPSILLLNSFSNYINNYTSIKKNTLETNIELLSFTNDKSRLKIYFNKLLAFLILNFISLTITFVVLVISLAYVLDGEYISKIFFIASAYSFTSIIISILFFGLLFLIDTFLMKQIKKRNNVYGLVMGLIGLIVGLSFTMTISIAPAAAKNKISEIFELKNKIQDQEEKSLSIEDIESENYNFLQKNNQIVSSPILVWKYMSKNSSKETPITPEIIDQYLKIYNEAAALYKNWSIINYFSFFNIFAKGANFDSISNEYYQNYPEQEAKRKQRDPNFYFFYKQEQNPEYTNQFLKIKLQVGIDQNPVDYYLTYSPITNYFLDEKIHPEQTKLLNYFNSNISLKKTLNQTKIGLNSVATDLENDSYFNNREVFINFETVAKIYYKLIEFNRGNNNFLEINWQNIEYILLKIAVTKNLILKIDYKNTINQKGEATSNLTELSKPQNKSNNLTATEKIISNLANDLLLEVFLDNKEMVSSKTIVAFGLKEETYQLWISALIIVILILVLNSAAIYRYRKMDIA
ncbi:hypothetical protein ACW95P_01110 [Candidatus Mycoplasma pogonae]